MEVMCMGGVRLDSQHGSYKTVWIKTHGISPVFQAADTLSDTNVYFQQTRMENESLYKAFHRKLCEILADLSGKTVNERFASLRLSTRSNTLLGKKSRKLCVLCLPHECWQA